MIGRPVRRAVAGSFWFAHSETLTLPVRPRESSGRPSSATAPIGTITGEEAAALTRLAPVAHDSGTLCGKRTIAGGRRALRHVMFQAALVAAHHNPSLRSFADRLRHAGKPHKVIITAVARKLVTIANALCKSRQKWIATTT
ncbi:IS110 family transposase [Paracoccus gahaiensis]|uniref:IS110 family transposase n=1 Tax=Paracoccus gahaiensis TaxID=1706839 RepID=A0A4U0R6L8_9RHOB|nr:IS110 family transposase [Paracoccus gahaiensis]